MTNQNKNSVRVISNAVLVRSEADSNRCTRFCRPLPSHSAIRPFLRSVSQPECKGRNILLISKIFCKIISIIAQIARLYRIILCPTPRFLSLFSASYLSSSLLALACSRLVVTRIVTRLLRCPDSAQAELYISLIYCVRVVLWLNLHITFSFYIFAIIGWTCYNEDLHPAHPYVI